MTLQELSAEYRSDAAILKARIEALREEQKGIRGKVERAEMEKRIQLLRSMYRDAKELAALTEHYYDRGYHSNAVYKI